MNSPLDLEHNVLGSLILKPRMLETSDLHAGEFSGARERQVFEIITKQWEVDRPDEIPLEGLKTLLGGNGAGEYVGRLVDARVPKPTAATFQSLIRALRRQNINRRLASKLQSELEIEKKTGTLDVAPLRSDFEALAELAQPRTEADTNQYLKTGRELQTLDLKTEYLAPGLIPAQAITVNHCLGGGGKTWLALQGAKAISTGSDFFSIPTMKRPVVYIDFENPLPMLIDRIRQLHVDDVMFWHQGFENKPPKLDSKNYALYKTLPPGSLIIFDTLRSAQDGDENDSGGMALVMGRLKEIRDAGFTIYVLHHTPRANERASKGSTVITDLADNVLALYRVRQNTYERIEDDNEPGPGDLLRLGTGQKTRYEPFQIFLRRSETGAFELAADPDREFLDAIAEYLRSSGHALTQSEIFTWAKGTLDIGKKTRLIALLRKGEGRWTSHKDGVKRLYDVSD